MNFLYSNNYKYLIPLKLKNWHKTKKIKIKKELISTTKKNNIRLLFLQLYFNCNIMTLKIRLGYRLDQSKTTADKSYD